MPSASPRASHLLPALLDGWTWRMAWRDSRTQRGRLIIFSLSIIAGLASLVAIHALKASVQSGLETQSKVLLGSDLQISSRQPLPPAALAAITARARQVSRETSFSSMLYFPGKDAARLVQVRALEGGFPFYGEVATTPKEAWSRLPGAEGMLVEPALLDQFGARIGDRVKLGAVEIPILGTVEKAPPGTNRFGGFAPTVFVNAATLARTGLLGSVSLASRTLHVELPPGRDGLAFKKELQARYPSQAWRMDTPEDRREALGDALENLQHFLGLVALVALVLGAIGVAGSVHAHLRRRGPAIAILRCLGCPGSAAYGIYLAQALVLGALGALLGAAIGLGLHAAVLRFYRDALPIALEATPPWSVIAQTTAAGFAVCASFALLPLQRIRQISPAATLRAGASLSLRGGFARTLPIYGFLAGLLLLIAWLNTANLRQALALVGGLAIAFALLALVAIALRAAARRLVRPTWPYLLRQGLANLYRPQNQTLLFLLSLGLGTFLLLTVLLTRQLVAARVSPQPLADSPNVYLVDVQPEQLAGVTALLAAQKLPVLESAPMITMRITAVRGTAVGELEKQNAVPKWVLQREFRSTYRAQLTASERLIGGHWIAQVTDPAAPVPLSLEAGLARDLRVQVGDALTLDVQGVPVEARITSLREVDWSRFKLNFFMVFPAGALEGAPGFQVVTTRIPEGATSGELQRALGRQFPNVSAIDLTQLLATVRGILEKASRVLALLAGSTVLAALPILIGTLLNGRDQRLRESVLLRTLGASAAQVRVILLVEYAALGLLSALTGVLLAVAAHAALALTLFEGSPWPAPGLLIKAFLATTALSVGAGLLLSRGLTRTSPLPVLRGSG